MLFLQELSGDQVVVRSSQANKRNETVLDLHGRPLADSNLESIKFTIKINILRLVLSIIFFLFFIGFVFCANVEIFV